MLQTTEVPPQVQPLQHAATFVREGFVTLNPAQANVILRECQYDRQRKVDGSHVAVLAELMKRGLWERKDKIDFARIGGRLSLVNGYHRMSAQVDAGKNIEWTIVIHECQSDAEVRTLYHKFDTNVRKRSDQNILQGVNFSETHGIGATMAKSLFAAVPIIANGLSAGNRSSASGLFERRITDDRLTLAAHYAEEARRLERLIATAPKHVRRALRPATITAVALVTLKSSPDVAADFWGGLAENDGLRRGDPRATLLQTIIDRDFSRSAVQAAVSACALAWNAHWERRELKIIKFHPGRTMRLLGTQYTVRT